MALATFEMMNSLKLTALPPKGGVTKQSRQEKAKGGTMGKSPKQEKAKSKAIIKQ